MQMSTQLYLRSHSQALRERVVSCCVVNGMIVLVSDVNVGKIPAFVYVENTAVGKKNFEHVIPTANDLQSRQGIFIRKIESISMR